MRLVPHPPTALRTAPVPWICLAIGLLLAAGCGDPPVVKQPPASPPPAPKTPSQPKQKKVPKAAPAKPLPIRVLKRDPRSVLDALQDLDVTMQRNADGNVVGVQLEEADDQVLELLGRLGQLRELTIAQADVTGESLSKLLGQVQLELLELHGRSISSEMLQPLAGQQRLKTLRLSATRVDDDLLKLIPELDGIEQLDLAWSRISDEGAGHLETLRSATSLDVSFTDLGDESVPALAKLTSLRTLVISGTSITAEGAAALREALPDTRIVGLPLDAPLPKPQTDEPPPGLIET